MKRVTLVVLLVLFAQSTMSAEFALSDISGKKHRLEDYRGQWVVINYWATWCPPCLDELPELVEFYEKYKGKGATVLGVNYEDISEDELQEFVQQNFISFPVLMAEPGTARFFGRLRGLPTTYVISPQGEQVYTHVGGLTKSLLEQIIAEKKAGL